MTDIPIPPDAGPAEHRRFRVYREGKQDEVQASFDDRKDAAAWVLGQVGTRYEIWDRRRRVWP